MNHSARRGAYSIWMSLGRSKKLGGIVPRHRVEPQRQVQVDPPCVLIVGDLRSSRDVSACDDPDRRTAKALVGVGIAAVVALRAGGLSRVVEEHDTC